jgi:hypothetical protein
MSEPDGLNPGHRASPEQPFLFQNITAAYTLFLSLTPLVFDGLLSTVAF